MALVPTSKCRRVDAGQSSSSRDAFAALLGKSYATDTCLKNICALMHAGESSAVEINPSRVWETEVSMQTPHGELFKSFKLPNKTEGLPEVEIPYLDPAGSLSFLSSRVPWFYQVLKDTCGKFENALHVIIYEDGATTGNLLAHDPAKSMELWYFTFEEFGETRTSMCDFWVTLCVIRTRIVRQVRGGLSAVAKALLLRFREMSNGIVVQQGPERLHLFCTLAFFLGDESGLQHVFRFKGELFNVYVGRFARRSGTVSN